MMRRISSIFLAVAALGTMSTGCRGWVSESPPVHLNQNMDTQEKLKAYRASDFFNDGRSMRAPVEGTVARDVSSTSQRSKDLLKDDDFYYRGQKDGQPAAGYPEGIKVDEAFVRRGQERYNIYCKPCHSKTGLGDGLVAKRLTIKPTNFHTEYMYTRAEGHIFGVISNGIRSMPSYRHQIPAKDRWAIVSYVRALQVSQNKAAYDKAVAAASADANAANSDDPKAAAIAKGKALFNSKTCAACHSLDGSRMVGPSVKGLFGKDEELADGSKVKVDDAYLKESILNPAAKVVKSYPPAMPPGLVSAEEADAIIEFIKSVN